MVAFVLRGKEKENNYLPMQARDGSKQSLVGHYGVSGAISVVASYLPWLSANIAHFSSD